jgi:hypothetical protein
MSNDVEAKLAQLKRLHDLGLLTDAELAEQKRAVLAALMGTTPTPTAPASLAGATRVESLPPVAATPTPSSPLAGATTVDPTADLPSRLGNYRDEIAVSAVGYDGSAGSSTGGVFVFKGSGSTTGVVSASAADHIISGSAGSTGLGESVSFGDVNGDGTTDLTVGSGSYSGYDGVYIFYNGGL